MSNGRACDLCLVSIEETEVVGSKGTQETRDAIAPVPGADSTQA